MTVHADLINTGSLRVTTEGREMVTEYLVTDVSGAPEYRRFNALKANGIPRVGQQHPADPVMLADSLEVLPVPENVSKFIVRVTYRTPDAADAAQDPSEPYGRATWRISARTTREETNRDARGELMRVYYQGYPVLELLDLDNQTVDTTRSGVLYLAGRIHVESVDRPIMFLEASRWERDNPEQRLRQHHGAINLEAWRGYAPGQVLLSDVGSEEDQSGGYRVTYGFSVNPDTWRVTTAIEIYQQVPQDATIGNGIFEFDVYPRVPFSTLALS